MPAAVHPYFMSISHRIQRMLKNDCRALKPFAQRNKNISCDCSFWLWSIALAGGQPAEPYSPATCLRIHIDPSPWDSDYRIKSSFSHLMTKWTQSHCNHLTVRTYFLKDTPAESILQCVQAACFTLPIAAAGEGAHSHSCLCEPCLADYEYKG